MDEKRLAELEKLEKKVKRQYKRQNEYVKSNYYRVSATLPKDYKDRLSAVGIKSINGLINQLVTAELERLEAARDSSGDGDPNDDFKAPFE